MERTDETNARSHGLTTLLISLAAAIVYWFSNPKPQSYYDYTFRVAENILRGAIGFTVRPPSWLNEFVLFEGFYYSVFPLGAVLTMVPFVFLKIVGVFTDMPGALIAALLAGISCFYLLKMADNYDKAPSKKILLVLSILFGTWMWTNLTFEGAWQLALGFAVVGELGSIYYTAYERRPLIAGAFFALAFGNRTEILLTAPLFLYLLTRTVTGENTSDNTGGDAVSQRSDTLKRLILFCLVPLILGVATLIYNYIRFHSFSDFGYSRIPGVLNEPWYDHGIFSIYYVPRQAWEMLMKGWHVKNVFPYLIPDGFSGSILLSSPFLFLLLCRGTDHGMLKYVSWIAIAILTFLLWIHGNSGGWQFSYRYAMILLPWIFLILLENSSKKITPVEWALYGFSFVMNAYATFLFHWTGYVKP